VDLAKASDQQAIELRKRASFVFQNYALFANKTALDNIAEGLITVWKQPKAEARATALGILKDIGLAEKQDAYPASSPAASNSASASAGPWRPTPR
jgi:putative amino-acid transport system ATP-binding protein